MTSTREQQLGDFGEDRVLQRLKERFDEIEKMPRNFPFFDLMAKRGARRLLIPVRTRNKYTASGALKKDAYKLYWKEGHFDSARKIATFFGADIFWVAVTVDTTTKTFCAYTDDVFELRSPKSIPMHPTLHVHRYECLARDEPHEAISASWSNIEETVSANDDTP
jgi:hypothetical protein